MGELKKNEKHSRSPLLASVPGFYTCKSSFLFTENNQTRHDATKAVQRRTFVLLLLSKLLFQRAPNNAPKPFANEGGEQLAELAPTLGHPPRGIPGAAASSSHG